MYYTYALACGHAQERPEKVLSNHLWAWGSAQAGNRGYGSIVSLAGHWRYASSSTYSLSADTARQKQVLARTQKNWNPHCWWRHKMMLPAWQKSLAILQKNKHKVTIWPSNSTPKSKNLDMNVYSSIIHNSQKMEIKISINWWINKMWSIHTMEYYSAITRNKILIHVTT